MVSLSAAVTVAMAAAVAPTAASGALIAPAVSTAPPSAHAIIRTFDLPGDGLSVGAGPTAANGIYVAANSTPGQLIRFDPVTLLETGRATVGNYPKGMTVSSDDTAYVVNANSDTLSVVQGADMTALSPIAVPDEPQAVALSRASDDTIFVSSSGSSQKISTLNARTLSGLAETSLGNRASPFGLAVSNDDSVYISSYDANKIYRFTPPTTTVADVITSPSASGPIGVAVTLGDVVYFTNETASTLSRFPVNAPGSVTALPVAFTPQGVAIGHDDTVYVASRSGKVSVIDPVSFTVDDSVTLTGWPGSIAVTQSGLIVSASLYSAKAWIIASVAPALTTTSGVAGETGQVSIGGLPTGVAIDDTTVSDVLFNGVPAPGWSRTPGTNTLTGPIPSGSGTVDVTLDLNGGNAVSAGTFTYLSPALQPTFDAPVATGDGFTINVTNYDNAWAWTPTTTAGSVTAGAPSGSALPLTVTGLAGGASATVTVDTTRAGYVTGSASASGTALPTPPPPPTPATAPLNVTATADNARAQVAWVAPTSSGTYSVTNFAVTAAPGGHTCLTTTLTCTVSGLANGTTYTFTVRALTGAGWGATSEPSNAVTPASRKSSLLISGTREGRSIRITGASSGLEPGTIVTPWVRKDEGAYIAGRELAVDASGNFTWQRRASTSSTWSVYATALDATSNIVVLT